MRREGNDFRVLRCGLSAATPQYSAATRPLCGCVLVAKGVQRGSRALRLQPKAPEQGHGGVLTTRSRLTGRVCCGRASGRPAAAISGCRGRRPPAASPRERVPAQLPLGSPPMRWRLITPPTEGAHEGTRVRVVEHQRNLADRHVGVVQYLPRHLEAGARRKGQHLITPGSRVTAPSRTACSESAGTLSPATCSTATIPCR